MNEEQWTAVDSYISDHLIPPDPALDAAKLTRPGSLIITNNVVRNGALADAGNTDPRVHGVRRFHEILSAEPRVSATTIQTVGCKGYDGFTFALVGGDGTR
jgi:predicted O-methyltransferase YrrM